MGIELYKHNKEAYDKIQKMFDEKNKVAIVHATGTGKSFLSLKWLYDNRDKKCLFLAPTYEILDQLETHIQNEGMSLADFPNLRLSIYPNFSRLTDSEISQLDFDNIVLDEFHRCGAQEWGRSINALLATNLNAKILGITATPIRYLDDNRNMANELFDGNIASEISLTDAVSQGILPMPTYISAVYSFNEDIDRIQSKIDRFENEEYKKVFQKRLDDAKRKLENADGIPEIFEKYMPNKSGKYIVFCKDYEHMELMKKQVKEWLNKVNPNVDIYSIYSEQGRELNKLNKSQFEGSTNDHIKLLFSIEMLNEGVHVEDIDGVIMLRPTISPIVYMQQLGRALSVGHNAHPIIFDIVNNINCHKSIYEVYDEVKKKIGNFGGSTSNQGQNDISLDDFKIIDELKQFSDILELIDKSISQDLYTTSKCELVVQKIIEFKNINGRMPSGVSQDKDERSLHTAFLYYKRHYTREQIKLLEENGITVVPKTSEEKNEETIYGIFEWLDTHNGKMPSGSSNDLYERSLYNSFIRNKEQFTDEQLKLLESRNIKIESRKGMSSEDIIQKIVDDVIEFKTSNDRMPSTANGGYEDSLYQKFIRNKKNYTEEQLQQLASVGIDVVFESEEKRQARKASYAEKVESTISELIEFKKTNGRMPSDSAESLEERSLYQLYLRTKDLYTEDQIKELADNGIVVKEKRKNSIEEILEDSADAIIMFIIANKKMPSGKSPDKQEQSLYNSFKRNKTRFSIEQKQKLFDIGAPIQIDEDFVTVSSMPVQEQMAFYSKLSSHYKEINNEVLYNFYMSKLAYISNSNNNIVEGSTYEGGNSNGVRRKS